MDLLDRFLGHDAWTTGQLLARCAHLSDAELDREFDIGHRTVRGTLLHLIGNLEIWTDLMLTRPQRPPRGAEAQTVAGMTERLNVAACELSQLARAVADRNGWDDTFTDYLDRPPKQKPYGAGIAHIITHSMHHRAQLLYLFRLLGAKDLPEGDVFSWEFRDASH